MEKSKIPTKPELENLYFNEDLSISKVAEKLHKGRTFIWELFKEYDIALKSRSKFASIDEQIEENLKRFKNKDALTWVKKWLEVKSAGNGYKKTHIQKVYTYLRILDPLSKPIQEIIKKGDSKAIIKLLNTPYGDSSIKIGSIRKNRYDIVTFFTWANKGRKPECVDFVDRSKNLDDLKKTRKYPDVTDEEMSLLIDNMPSVRDMTWASIMAEVPTRSIEMRNLDIGDIESDEYGFILSIGSKTEKGFRRVRLVHSAPQLRLFLSTHKFRNEPDKPLFYSLAKRDKDKRIDYWAMNHALKEGLRRAKIKKKITLHDFRRFSTTQKLKDPKFTTNEVQVLGGWSSIKLLDTYSKIKDIDVNKKILESSGLIKRKEEIKESKLKPVECPRCKTLNPRTLETCSKCWLPLTSKKAKEVWEEQKEADLIQRRTIEKKGSINRDLLKETIKEMIKSGEIEL